MKIADGVEMLEISANVIGTPNTIYPALIWDNDNVVLVDTGYPGQFPLIKQAIENAGVPFQKLNKVIITHQDIDHIGNLSSFLSELPKRAEVITHEEERPYIEGSKRPIKMAMLEDRLDSLPENMKEIYGGMKRSYEKNKTIVDKTVADGEEIPYCGGITVIHTPGHTPGHICLYVQKSKTLITGDAMNIENGRLVGPNPKHTFDMDLGIMSLKKLTQFDIDTVICYHGGLYRNGTNQSIDRLLNGE